MIDFLKMQKDYIDRWWKKEMRIGSPDVNSCLFQAREKDALIMVESYVIARIPSERWVFIQAARDQRPMDLGKIWESFQGAETIGIRPLYDMTREKRIYRVFEDENGGKHGFNPVLLDRYKISADDYRFRYAPAARAIIVYIYDDPVFVILEVAPKTIGLE